MNKRVKHSLLLTIVGLFLATSVWAGYTNPTTNIIESTMIVKSGWSRSDASTSGPNSGEAPNKAIDGNTGTQWISWSCNSADRAWLAIDLGEVFSLTECATIWQQAGRAPSRYCIQVASSLTDDAPDSFEDDVNLSNTGWTTVVEVNETQVIGSENRYAFNTYPVRARYVRIACSNYIDQIGLTEFRLYSDGNSSVEVTPTITSATSSADIVSGSTTLELVAEDHNGDPLKTFVLQDQFGKYYYSMTDANNEITISGLEDKRYILTAWAVESGYRSAGRTIVVGENTFSSSTNLALNKPASAVGQKNAEESPNKANDGNLGNGWRSAEPVPEADRGNVWWYVDLEDQFELKYVGLFWEGAYATGFIMQIRKEEPTSAEAGDDNEWTTFLTFSGEPNVGDTEDKINLYGDVEGAAAAFNIVPKGRYVRIRITDAHNNWSWGVKLRELRIFGNGYLPLNDVKPVISSASYNGVNGDYTAVKFNVTASDDVTDPVTQYLVIDKNKKQHHVTVAEGVVTVTDMPSGKNQNVSIYAFDAAGNRSNAEEVSISYLRPDENIAENKTTNACVDINTGEGHAKAVDGKENTDWTSWSNADHTNDWWYVDLGDYYDIRRIEVVWTTDRHSTDYDIQYRQYAPEVDGATASEWHTISEFAGKSGNQNIDVVDTKAQYICMRSRSGNTGDQVRLAEFRVYGKAYASTDVEAPVISAASYNGVSADWTELKFNITVSDNVTSNDDLVYVIEDPNGAEHAATYSAGVLTVTGMPTFKNGDFTIYATDAVDNISTGYVVENVSYVNPTDNIAKNKSAYGCVNLGGGEAPGVAVDGNESTDWTSWNYAHHDNAWWYVDLGDYYDIRRIEVVWTTDRHSTDYDIQYRQNAPAEDGATASEWHTISEFAGKSGNQSIDIVDTKAQFICLRSRANYSNNQVRLAELRVYGKSFAPKDLTAPVISAASYNGISADGTELKLNITVSDNVTANADLVYVVEDPDGAEHAASYSAGVLSVTGMPTFKNSSVTIYATDAVDNRSEGFVVWSVSYVDPTENLAYHKDAYACVHINDGEGRLMPVDGNTATRWTSYSHAHHDNDWWYVDLGDVYDIRRIEVVWQEDRHSTDFSIQYRENAPEGDSGATEDEWETKYSNLSGDQELVDITDMQARYICMRSKDYVHEQEHAQVRMAEFRVFGREFTYADAITLSESTNNSSVITANDGRDVNVTLARGFIADGGNYTLCLPFDMTAEQCEAAFHEGYQLWYLEDSRLKDNGDIYLNFISADNIVAGRPYLFCPATTVASGTVIENVHINSAASTASNSTYANFVGTYDKIPQATLNANNKAYLLGADNWLFSAENLRYDMKALRAYFELNPDVVNNVHPRMRVVFNEPRTDMPTDIEDVEQVAAPAKRIVNGQLIIEKNGILYNAQGKRLQ